MTGQVYFTRTVDWGSCSFEWCTDVRHSLAWSRGLSYDHVSPQVTLSRGNRKEHEISKTGELFYMFFLQITLGFDITELYWCTLSCTGVQFVNIIRYFLSSLYYCFSSEASILYNYIITHSRRWCTLRCYPLSATVKGTNTRNWQ